MANKNLDIDYLGYNYSFPDIPIKKSEREITISIADTKINKIKSRIIFSFLDFIKNQNFRLLESRINFLTSNYFVYGNISTSNLKSGIYYNYCHINNIDKINSLDIFLRKTLFAKNQSFGSKLNSKITQNQRDILVKYSFVSGFNNRLLVDFSADEMNEIKQCWA